MILKLKIGQYIRRDFGPNDYSIGIITEINSKYVRYNTIYNPSINSIGIDGAFNLGDVTIKTTILSEKESRTIKVLFGGGTSDGL